MTLQQLNNLKEFYTKQLGKNKRFNFKIKDVIYLINEVIWYLENNDWMTFEDIDEIHIYNMKMSIKELSWFTKEIKGNDLKEYKNIIGGLNL